MQGIIVLLGTHIESCVLLNNSGSYVDYWIIFNSPPSLLPCVSVYSWYVLMWFPPTNCTDSPCFPLLIYKWSQVCLSSTCNHHFSFRLKVGKLGEETGKPVGIEVFRKVLNLIQKCELLIKYYSRMKTHIQR